MKHEPEKVISKNRICQGPQPKPDARQISRPNTESRMNHESIMIWKWIHSTRSKQQTEARHPNLTETKPLPKTSQERMNSGTYRDLSRSKIRHHHQKNLCLRTAMKMNHSSHTLEWLTETNGTNNQRTDLGNRSTAIIRILTKEQR